MGEEQRSEDPWAEELTQAVRGDEEALGRLVERLLPVVQARVARTLLRQESRRTNLRQVAEDLTQDVFSALLADGAKTLRDWQPERGLSLERFVGLVAERRVISALRRVRRNPWTEEPTPMEALDRSAPERGPEERAASRQHLRLVLERFKRELSPLGWHLFELLFLHECSVEEVGRQTRMSHDAVYAWRSRLRRLARRLQQEQQQGG